MTREGEKVVEKALADESWGLVARGGRWVLAGGVRGRHGVEGRLLRTAYPAPAPVSQELPPAGACEGRTEAATPAPPEGLEASLRGRWTLCALLEATLNPSFLGWESLGMLGCSWEGVGEVGNPKEVKEQREKKTRRDSLA